MDANKNQLKDLIKQKLDLLTPVLPLNWEIVEQAGHYYIFALGNFKKIRISITKNDWSHIKNNLECSKYLLEISMDYTFFAKFEGFNVISMLRSMIAYLKENSNSHLSELISYAKLDKLHKGDVIYKINENGVLIAYPITRVSKTSAWSSHYKFNRSLEKGVIHHVSRWENEGDKYHYVLGNPDFNKKYYYNRLIFSPLLEPKTINGIGKSPSFLYSDR